jgi:hypothetical protein
MPRKNPNSGGGGAITPGLAQVEQAVQFTNKEVLAPTWNLPPTIKPTGMDVGANALAEQAGAMMIEDMRTFLQSTEMVLVPATAKALSEALEGNPAGAATIALIDAMLTSIAAYSAVIIANAGKAAGDFA